MSQDNLQQPLLLNDSVKDSIDPQPSPIKQLNSEFAKEQPEPIKEEEEDAQLPPQEKQKPIVMTYIPSQEPEPVESIIEEPTMLKQTKKRYKCMQTCGIVCLLIGFVLIFAVPPFLNSVIISECIDQVIMGPENQDLWAHFPGKSKAIITRNFTFHRLMNEDDFLLRHKKPQFQEVAGFKIQEVQDFLDITYLDDGNKVKIRDWTRFNEWNQSKSLDTPVTVLNVGNLGYWSTLKVSRPTLILQQGLALLFTNMEQSIIPTLIGTGINSQFLPNSSAAISSLFAPSGVEKENYDFLWSDPSFGMYNPQNLGEWAQAAMQSYDNPQQSYQFSQTGSMLKNYFVLTDSQLESILSKVHGYVENIRNILLQNHYCADVGMQNCTGRYLAVAQITDGWATANPPPVSTITPNDTICDNNFTCKGYYPELFAYEKNVFWGSLAALKVKHNSEIVFKREQVLGWFDYNRTYKEGVDYNTAENCLLHIGNLDAIWEWGTAYDRDEDLQGVARIAQRLKLQNETQGLVVWQWLKYLATVFVKQHEKTNEKLGISNLFSQGLYQQLSKTIDTLQPYLIKKMMVQKLSGKECHLFFENTLDEEQGSALVDKLCNNYTNIHTEQFAEFMINSCERKYGPAWQQLRNEGLSLLTLEYHCQNNGKDNVGTFIHNVKIELNDHYNCSMTPKPYCSNYELALQQWANSTVTLNPPSSISKTVNSSPTFNSWNPDVKAFEYGYFLSKFTPEERSVFPLFTTDQLYPFMTFEEWYSASTVLRYIISGSFGDYFIQYVRWFSIEITLNGFTMTRTVREILFGYEDEFLAEIKNQYPPFGGDPSTPSVIALNDLNLTESEANMSIVFLTGKDDFRNVYQNYQINGYRYSVNNYSSFNGNTTTWEWRSPWKENDYFYGTTAKIFAPNQFQADNMSLLINQVQRYGSNHFYNQSYLRNRFGMDLYISFLNTQIGDVSPQNDKYYQTIKNIFNASSIYGIPLYLSKNHFLNASQFLERVDIYNEDYTIKYEETSEWDQTFILVQPYTGVSFQSQIYLQNNYYHQPDELYPYPIDTMLPIFAISRSGNLTEEAFHQLYDPLVTGLKVKSAALYVGIAFVVVFGAMLGFAIYKRKHLKKKEHKESQLGISLQKVMPNGEKHDVRLTIEVEE